jgi:hypothetical protein
MAYMLLRQKVQDYAKWKVVFDEGAEKHRRAAGSKGGLVFRDAENSNIVTILLKWESPEKMKKFIQSMKSPEMQETFKAAGVINPPLAVQEFGDSEETLL